MADPDPSIHRRGPTGGKRTEVASGVGATQSPLRRAIGAARKAGVRAALRVVPKDGTAVVSTFPDFDDMLRALLPELRRRGTSVTILTYGADVPRPSWLPDDVVVHERGAPAAYWRYLRASVVYFTHGFYGSVPPVRSQVAANLWHGMPLKRIDPGLGILGPDCTFTVSTSEAFTAPLAECFRIAPADVVRIGLPRNDLLVDPTVPDPAAVRAEVGASGYVVMLPTYRSTPVGGRLDSTDDSLRIAPEDLATLDRLLEVEDLALVVKPHPASPPGILDSWRSDRVVVIDDRWLLDRDLTLYGVLGGARALVTDYSSVAVDWIVTDRACVLYQSDQQAYVADRGLIISDEAMATLGTVVTDPAGLVEALRAAARRGFERAEPADPAFWSTPRDGAAGRVVDEVERRLR